MKKILTILLLVCSTVTFAQSPNWLWAKSMGGISTFPAVHAEDDWGKSIATDAAGNVYTTGTFRGKADFDPGIGTYYLNAQPTGGIFISKTDSSGNFVWAKQIGEGFCSGYSIALDVWGNIYTSGDFLGMVDFDPDTAAADTFTLISSSSSGMYVLKLDASGNFLWAKAMNGSGQKFVHDMVIDASGNVYTTGGFSYAVDFNPGDIYNVALLLVSVWLCTALVISIAVIDIIENHGIRKPK